MPISCSRYIITPYWKLYLTLCGYRKEKTKLSSGFFKGVSVGKTPQSLSLVDVKPRKDMYNGAVVIRPSVEGGVKHSIDQSEFFSVICDI